ncbi:hypothetical protein BDE36_1071 [Arcticibacter tournemirensis]|nr:hypothetical protein BDE36_1071 [Arcticibacter tournemirensis]
MQLDYNSREMLLEILQKRQIEARRNDMARAAKKSIKDYHLGKTKPLTVDETIDRLNTLA